MEKCLLYPKGILKCIKMCVRAYKATAHECIKMCVRAYKETAHKRKINGCHLNFGLPKKRGGSTYLSARNRTAFLTMPYLVKRARCKRKGVCESNDCNKIANLCSVHVQVKERAGLHEPYVEYE